MILVFLNRGTFLNLLVIGLHELMFIHPCRIMALNCANCVNVYFNDVLFFL